MIYYTIIPQDYPEEQYQLLYSSLRPMLPKFRRDKCDGIIPARERNFSALAYFLLLEGLKREYPERLSFTISDNALQEYVSFVHSDKGKPQLSAPYSDIHFNLSHCRTGIACGIAGHDVGIDIQDIRNIRSGTVMKVAAPILHDDNTVNPDEFASFWSRYEAYAKLTGEGLRLSSRDCDYLSDEFLINHHVHIDTCTLYYPGTKKTAAYMSAAYYLNNSYNHCEHDGPSTESDPLSLCLSAGSAVNISLDELCHSIFL